jgi:hypothetical protein
VRLTVASTVAVVPAYVAARVLTAGLGLRADAAFVALVVGLVIGAAVFFGLARRMRIRDLDRLVGLVRGRLRPG